MGGERKDHILWGRDFQKWKYTYQALEAALRAVEASAGKPNPSILSSMRGAERHPQFLEMKLRIMECYMQKMNDSRADMLKKRRVDFETVKKAELGSIKKVRERIDEIMDELGKPLETPKAAEGGEAADTWADVAAEVGIEASTELQNLQERKEEECAELRRFLQSKSGEARLAAADGLIDAKDANSIARYAYEEVLPKNRLHALDYVLVAVRLGALLGREEKSMLLRIMEDLDSACAEKACSIALRLFGRNELGGEQLEYLLKRETIAGDEGRPESSKIAGLRLRLACGGEMMEPKERASLLSRVEETVWMGARLGEKEMGMLSAFMGKAGGEVAKQGWSLVMELLEKDCVPKGNIAELIRVSERIEDQNERVRVQKKLAVKVSVDGTGDAAADGILKRIRIEKLVLETVSERPSGVPMRKSQPPAANGKKDSIPPAEKVPAKA